MKFELTKKHEGLVITTKWKNKWKRNWRNQYVTGVIKFAPGGVQLWYGLGDWTWLRISCDKRSFKPLCKEEAIIWKLEHNM